MVVRVGGFLGLSPWNEKKGGVRVRGGGEEGKREGKG